MVATNEKQRFALKAVTPQTRPSPVIGSEGTTADLDNATHDPQDPSQQLIRASQGHSIPMQSENLLSPILASDPDCPEQAVHGTDDKAWNLILKSGGLRRMGRSHVHFAPGVPDAAARGSSAPQAPASKTDNSEINELSLGREKTMTEPTISSAAVCEPVAPEKVVSGMRKSSTILIWVDVKRSLLAGRLKWWRSANNVVLTEGDEHGVVGMEWVDRVETRSRTTKQSGQGAGERKVVWERDKGDERLKEEEEEEKAIAVRRDGCAAVEAGTNAREEGYENKDQRVGKKGRWA